MAKSQSKSSEREMAWAETFKAMGDGTRLSIMLRLMQSPQCVTDIASGLKMDAPKVSFHLTRLRYAGLVSQERQGQRVVYSINPALLKKGSSCTIEVQGCVLSFPK